MTFEERGARTGLAAGERRIMEAVAEIVKNGAYGLLQGGFHTPYHRWAIASVLMTCANLFDCEEMRQAAMQYQIKYLDLQHRLKKRY